MYKISEIISLPVITLYESEFQGTAYNIIFDCKTQKCKFLCLLNEEDNIEKVVNIDDIYKIGTHCIFIKNTSCIELKSNYDYLACNYSSLINLPIYSLNGENVGTTLDIELDNRFNLEKIHLNNGNILDKNTLVNIGKSTILISDTNVNISKFKPKLKPAPKKDCPNKVIILSELEEINNTNIPYQNNIENKQQSRIITDYRFLINRKITKDILALNGEIIAKQNSKVTKEIINKASLYGKLMEIARYSKKELT